MPQLAGLSGPNSARSNATNTSNASIAVTRDKLIANIETTLAGCLDPAAAKKVLASLAPVISQQAHEESVRSAGSEAESPLPSSRSHYSNTSGFSNSNSQHHSSPYGRGSGASRHAQNAEIGRGRRQPRLIPPSTTRHHTSSDVAYRLQLPPLSPTHILRFA